MAEYTETRRGEGTNKTLDIKLQIKLCKVNDRLMEKYARTEKEYYNPSKKDMNIYVEIGRERRIAKQMGVNKVMMPELEFIHPKTGKMYKNLGTYLEERDDEYPLYIFSERYIDRWNSKSPHIKQVIKQSKLNVDLIKEYAKIVPGYYIPNNKDLERYAANNRDIKTTKYKGITKIVMPILEFTNPKTGKKYEHLGLYLYERDTKCPLKTVNNN